MNAPWDQGQGGQRIMSQADCDAIVERLQAFARGGGETAPHITSWWTGELRWGRNRVTLASDRRDLRVRVQRVINGLVGRSETNQSDVESLEGVVRAAERYFNPPRGFGKPRSYAPPGPEQATPRPSIWSDATYNLTAEARAEIARTLAAAAEAKGLLSAGYLEVRAGSRLQLINRERCYATYTQAQCSLTVRDREGTGSGWAGLSSHDWAKIDAPALAQQALEKCLASRNPVALEPGRYTVVLEPQAVADILEPLLADFDRKTAEGGNSGPFHLSPRKSKLGLKVVDERLTLSHDPLDPDIGILPEPGMRPVTWIDHGVLTNLAYDREYALWEMGEDVPVHSPEIGYRLSGSGSPTSIEEMIATTKRGLLVTRFWGIKVMGKGLQTGQTRDGLWLIENGKITKPVKNFRFTESPLFMLNQLEQIGVPVPVFRPVRHPDPYGMFLSPTPSLLLTPAVVPAIKARDFSFTSMADAV